MIVCWRVGKERETVCLWVDATGTRIDRLTLGWELWARGLEVAGDDPCPLSMTLLGWLGGFGTGLHYRASTEVRDALVHLLVEYRGAN